MWKREAIINLLFAINNYITYICNMKANNKDKKCGIYCIKNIINNKVYIGKSKNIYYRIRQHLYDLKNRRIENENTHLMASWYKYGNDNFEYTILEILNDEELCREREIYWMKYYKSLDRKYGYNFRQDSSTNMIVHPETSLKISNRLKKEWKSGIRNDHGKKLALNWKNNPNRKLEQSELLSNIKTKYIYKLYNINEDFIEECKFQRLKELNLQNVLASFHRSKSNFVKYKTFFIKRVIIEDIVQSSQKYEIKCNNYISVYDNGKTKHKGAFEYDKVVGSEPAYHKDNSFRIVPLAISNYYVKGIPIEETIYNDTNIYDFCGRQKFNRDSSGEIQYVKGFENIIEPQQKNVRYYISKSSKTFVKRYTKGSIEIINKGYQVEIFNKYIEKPMKEYNIDYSFYITEAYKIIDIIEDKQLTLF